jgi:pimeloyl-ACP methyl ester carboxylesterase
MKLRSVLRGLGWGAAGGYLLAQQWWVWKRLLAVEVHQSLAQHTNQGQPGARLIESRREQNYTLKHSVEDGIERIIYQPSQARFRTPLLLLHGMWHGAWCWRLWQELFAEWGWESIAFSLPGHAGSPTQRPIGACSLDYYLGFLKEEIDRLPVKPVLIGHSMGGALAQWYLKYAGDDLPAVVLAAPWVADSALRDGFLRLLKNDPLGCAMIPLTWDAWPLVRNPQVAQRLLLGRQAFYSAVAFHAQLGRESVLGILQHNPPLWRPSQTVQTPLLVVAGQFDQAVSLAGLRRTAIYYQAELFVAPQAGHNLMMEQHSLEIAEAIHSWLQRQGIA